METTQPQVETPKADSPEATGHQGQPEKAEIAINPGEDWGTALMGFLIFLAPLYYFFVWKNIPWDDKEGNTLRWWITGGIAVVGTFVIIFSRRRKAKVLESISNYTVLIFIVLGVALFSVYFDKPGEGILFKLFVIIYFSFLPAWLYLNFISIKGRTLWEEYVLNLYRLRVDDFAHLPEPPAQSVFFNMWRTAREGSMPQATQEREKSLYEKKFEGLFGAVRPDAKGAISFLRGENLWPVAIATLLISVGWVLVTEPESIFKITILPGFTLTNGPPLPLETFRFAFLGAYFYVLQMLVRRYFQNDLKTSAYVSSTMRIIVVMLLVWAIEAVWSDQNQQAQRSLLAFVIGVFPHVGWQAIQAVVKLPLKVVVPSLEQKFPLNELDGLNIWYESRLLEEGIEDMQNLATANLVDVMLNTRIPVERLVDWVDQSLLYLHLGDGNSKDGKENREKIRLFGIRTATDLEDAFDAPQPEVVKKLDGLLDKNEKEPSVLRTILATFRNEPNLQQVRHWRSFAEIERAR